MSYKEDMPVWLAKVLTDMKSGENEQGWVTRIVPIIMGQLAKSYANGQRDCAKCNPREHRVQEVPAR